MNRTSLMAVLMLLFTTGTASAAGAWAEVGQAGDLPATAQVTVGAGPLTQITGSLLVPDDKDMYRIFIDAGGGFSAVVASTVPSDDTKLYLFRSDGRGILGDDDSAGVGVLSALPLGHPALASLSAGPYYLAISDYDFLPVSSTGAIFPSGNLVGPTGPGGANPIIGWTNDVNESTYTYDIRLTGARFSNVPEPAAALLSIVGGMFVSAAVRRRLRIPAGSAAC